MQHWLAVVFKSVFQKQQSTFNKQNIFQSTHQWTNEGQPMTSVAKTTLDISLTYPKCCYSSRQPHSLQEIQQLNWTSEQLVETNLVKESKDMFFLFWCSFPLNEDGWSIHPHQCASTSQSRNMKAQVANCQSPAVRCHKIPFEPKQRYSSWTFAGISSYKGCGLDWRHNYSKRFFSASNVHPCVWSIGEGWRFAEDGRIPNKWQSL